MTVLEFDEIEKYREVKEWITSMSPSQLMEKKQNVVDVVWDFWSFVTLLVFGQPPKR